MSIMTALGRLLGGAASTGISEAANGIGDAAIKMRSAITGDLPPEKKAELEGHLADIDARLAEVQGKVNEVEAGSASFFVAGWRPAAGWLGVLGLSYQVLAWPFLVWFARILELPEPPQIDTGVLLTIITGMLGLGGMRTFEKVKGVHQEH